MGRITSKREIPVERLVPYARNAKQHSPEQVTKIADSIREFGFLNPVLVDSENNIIAGHGRVLAAQEMGLDKVPCIVIDGLTDEQRRAYIMADNRLGELAHWDMDLVEAELERLDMEGFNIELTGFDGFSKPKHSEEYEAEQVEQAKEALRDNFFVPPFSVIDSRQAWWQNRKKAWKTFGIRSAEGRGADGDGHKDGLTFSNSSQPLAVYKAKEKLEKQLGRHLTWEEYYEISGDESTLATDSIFDPVLTETIIRWFSKLGGAVLDPFAGGSVRGVISSLLGRKYTGIDLSARQIAANYSNWEELDHLPILEKDYEPETPTWIVGDSLQVDELVKQNDFDLLFSCPPYFDLEKYSDDERDLSNMSDQDFVDTYNEIIKRCVARLKPNAFAVFVVGDVRGKDGTYKDFVSRTIDAFKKAGMELWNEAVLLTPVASATIRARRPFEKSRKLCKLHQNVLVFKSDADPEEKAKYLDKYIEESDAVLLDAHESVLTFIKGDARSLTDTLGEVDADTGETFFIDLE